VTYGTPLCGPVQELRPSKHGQNLKRRTDSISYRLRRRSIIHPGAHQFSALQAYPQYSGQYGVVEDVADGSGRLIVRLEGADNPISLKPANLEKGVQRLQDARRQRVLALKERPFLRPRMPEGQLAREQKAVRQAALAGQSPWHCPAGGTGSRRGNARVQNCSSRRARARAGQEGESMVDSAFVKQKAVDWRRRVCKLYKEWKSVKRGQASRGDARDLMLALLAEAEIPVPADEKGPL
jgi:hypothetical protein